jgi:PleD family two-component response regulator
MRTGKPIIGHVEMCILGSGQLKWYSASKYPLHDENGHIIGTWGTSREITDLKKVEQELAIANAELKRQSRIDELSGLYNRRYFYELLTSTARKYSARRDLGFHDTFSLVTLDIDRFKTINDTLGHLAGDTAIRHMAGVLLKNCAFNRYDFPDRRRRICLILPDTDYEAPECRRSGFDALPRVRRFF